MIHRFLQALRAVASVAVVLVAVLLPEIARACAVCGGGADEDGSRTAYIVTAVILSVLPVSVVGGFVLWLRRLHRQQAQRTLGLRSSSS
jgi:hypothetical protein